MTTDLDYARLHLDTGFVRDARGLLLRVNERSVVNPIGPPPLLCVRRTVSGNVWALRAGLPEELLAELEVIVSCEPTAGDLAAPPHCRDRLLNVLAPVASVQDEQSGPCYLLPKCAAPTGTLQITPEYAHVLRAGFPDVLPDLAFSEPCVAVLEGGDAVSVCFSARSSAVAAEAGVVTLPEARGRGYATAVTAGWAAIAQAQGKQPLYSTDWENHASRAVARHLGARLFASAWSLTDVRRRPKNHP